MRDSNTSRIAAVVCGGLPLIVLHKHEALVVYSLTAVLFGIALVGEYPPFGTRWFWQAISTIIIFHIAIVLMMLMATSRIPVINGLPRLLFGVVAVVTLVEW